MSQADFFLTAANNFCSCHLATIFRPIIIWAIKQIGNIYQPYLSPTNYIWIAILYNGGIAANWWTFFYLSIPSPLTRYTNFPELDWHCWGLGCWKRESNPRTSSKRPTRRATTVASFLLLLFLFLSWKETGEKKWTQVGKTSSKSWRANPWKKCTPVKKQRCRSLPRGQWHSI